MNLIPDGWHIALSQAGPDGDSAATGDLDILQDVAIGSLAPAGAWPVVDGAGVATDQVFEVHAPATLSLVALDRRRRRFYDSGEVTLRARDAVTFTDGFTVHSNGELEVILDPAAGSGTALP